MKSQKGHTAYNSSGRAFFKARLHEQRKLSDPILKRTAKFDYEEPSDEELTAATGRIFEMLDREENGPTPR